ncbi:MAG: PCRF domain-containing protein, partial [Pirellula sp.]
MNSASGWCRCEGGFDYDGKSLQIDKLEAEMASPTFWDSPEKAQSVVLELKNLRKVVDPLKQVVASCSDLEELAQMADEDPSLGEEISSELLRLEQATEQLEIRALL